MGNGNQDPDSAIKEKETVIAPKNGDNRAWIMIVGAILLAILLAGLVFFAYSAFKERRVNENLTKDNKELARTNEILAEKNEMLAKDREALGKANEILKKEKQALVDANKNLAGENEIMAEKNEALKREAERSTEEAEKLKSPGGIIKAGEGYWHITSDYVKENLSALGYCGDLSDKDAIKSFVNKTVLKNLIANGILDPETGREIRIREAYKHAINISHDDKHNLVFVLSSRGADNNWRETADDTLSGTPDRPAEFKADIKSGPGALQSYEYVAQEKMIGQNLVPSCP